MILTPRRVRLFTPPLEPPLPVVPGHVGPAELPRVVPQYTPSNSLTGTVHTPANAAALQALITWNGAAQPGDTIVLTRGVTYNTPSMSTQVFTPRPGAESNPIRVITSDTSAIPAPNVRITPASRAAAPHFRCQFNNTPAVRVLGSGWHFVGVEADAGSVTSTFGIVVLGYVWAGNYSPSVTYERGQLVGVSTDLTQGWISLQNGNVGNPLVEGAWWTRYTTASMPTNLVLDRCDISARSYSNQANGIVYADTRALVVRDSWIWGEGRLASEDKAFLTVEMAGPLLFENNMCCSSSIPFLAGGSDPRTKSIPTDLTICRNHFFKPTRFLPFHPDWDGNDRQHKNSFELKVGLRVDLRDNVFENHYDGNQSQYYMVVLKATNQQGTFNEVRTEDITVRYNRFVNPGGAIGIGPDPAIGGGTTSGVRRFSIYENYSPTVLGRWNTGNNQRSFFMQIGAADQSNGPFSDIWVERNTFVSKHPSQETQDNAFVNASTAQLPGLVWRSNVLDHGEFGIRGEAGTFLGIGQFQGPGSSASGNWLFVDTPSSAPTPALYPAGQLNTSTNAAQLFVDRGAGNYRTASAIATQGHDGGRPGANIDLINQRTAGCETGVWT